METIYKIKEGQGDDPRTIVRENATIEIDLNTLSNELNHFEKTITELEAQAKLEEAKMQNIVDFHPDVLEFEDEKMNEISMYYQAKQKSKILREKLEESKMTQIEIIQMSKDIEEQTGLKP